MANLYDDTKECGHRPEGPVRVRCDRPTLPLRGQRGGMLQRARIPKPCILRSLEHIDFFYRDASDSYIAQGPWYGTGDLGPLGHIDLVYVVLTDSCDARAPLPTIPLLTELRCHPGQDLPYRSSRPGLAFRVVQGRICLTGCPARICLTGRPGQSLPYRSSRPKSSYLVSAYTTGHYSLTAVIRRVAS